MITLLEKDRLGRFVIERTLGSGSMGIVYLAHDSQLDRSVAIKTILIPEDMELSRRLQLMQSLKQEARTAARLTHPGIVQIYDAGEFQGEPFIVLEAIQGKPLSDLLADKAGLTVESSVMIMSELLEAMAFAHDRGIIHRDLKPGNIMIQTDGHARVMDFGIAHALNDSASARVRGLAGTPRYMSPEQVRGGELRPSSDIFSLGVIFYEMLTGLRPFEQRELPDLLKAISETAHRPAHLVRPELPRPLSDLIDRALSKSAEARFANAREMAEALKTYRNANTAPAPENQAQGRRDIFDFIRRKIERKGDFPATSKYMAEVAASAQSKNTSAASVSEAILKDFALTNRILRMVNSPFYRGVGPPITTISRAVVILGMDTVTSVATGLGIFEHFSRKGGNAAGLKEQAIKALLTALQARQLARHINYANPEEAFIAGMLHHLGKLIVAFYFPEEHADIQRLLEQPGMDEELASRQVMRVSFVELGEELATGWNMPDSIIKAMRGIKPSQSPTRTAENMLKTVVTISRHLSDAALIADTRERQTVVNRISREFENMLRVTPQQLTAIVEDSLRHAWELSHNLRVDLKKLGVAQTLLPGTESDASTQTQPGARDTLDETRPPGTDASAELRQKLIMRTVGEISAALMSDFQVNDILIMVIEAMYRGIGFQHVVLAMVNPKRDTVTYRFGLGERIDDIKQKFQFQLNRSGGLPAACVMNEKEVYLPDVSQSAGNLAFSPTLLAMLKPRSVAMLPLTVSAKAIGLFYMDRSAEQDEISHQDLRDVRTLANQAVLAIQTSLAKKK